MIDSDSLMSLVQEADEFTDIHHLQPAALNGFGSLVLRYNAAIKKYECSTAAGGVAKKEASTRDAFRALCLAMFAFHALKDYIEQASAEYWRYRWLRLLVWRNRPSSDFLDDYEEVLSDLRVQIKQAQYALGLSICQLIQLPMIDQCALSYTQLAPLLRFVLQYGSQRAHHALLHHPFFFDNHEGAFLRLRPMPIFNGGSFFLGGYSDGSLMTLSGKTALKHPDELIAIPEALQHFVPTKPRLPVWLAPGAHCRYDYFTEGWRSWRFAQMNALWRQAAACLGRLDLDETHNTKAITALRKLKGILRAEQHAVQRCQATLFSKPPHSLMGWVQTWTRRHSHICFATLHREWAGREMRLLEAKVALLQQMDLAYGLLPLRKRKKGAAQIKQLITELEGDLDALSDAVEEKAHLKTRFHPIQQGWARQAPPPRPPAFAC